MKIQRTIPPTAAPIDLSCLLNGIKGIWAGRKYIEKFISEIREYFAVRYVFPVSSGKAALTIALSALKSIAHSKDEVIVPAYTCFSVPSAIIKAGLKIVPCDVDPVTFDFDYAQLEKKISERTLCVVPTHLFGIPADMDRIRGICRKKKLFIIEDAAQAMGGTYKKEKLGTIGDIGIFSLGRGKNITCGSGGIIITDSKLIARALEIVYSVLDVPKMRENIIEYLKFAAMSFFIRPALYWFPSGLAALKLGETVFYRDFPVKKMSGVNAALMSGWQRRLRYANLLRRRNAGLLRRALDMPLLHSASINFLRLPYLTKDAVSRESIYSDSVKAGAGIGKMYPTPINEIEDIRGSFEGQSFPRSKYISERLLTLPTHHLLNADDRKVICDVISHIVGQDRSVFIVGPSLSRKYSSNFDAPSPAPSPSRGEGSIKFPSLEERGQRGRC